MNEQILHDKREKSVNSMTEDEQKLLLTLMIFYASEHPEILTDATRKAMNGLEHKLSESTSG